MSNTRQIAMVHEAYVTDYHGEWGPGAWSHDMHPHGAATSGGAGYPYIQAYLISTYMGGARQAFTCPADDMKHHTPPTMRFIANMDSGVVEIGLSYAMNNHRPRHASVLQPGGHGIQNPTKMKLVREPARFGLFFETNHYNAGLSTASWVPNAVGGAVYRHPSTTMNIPFADGHAASRIDKEVNYAASLGPVRPENWNALWYGSNTYTSNRVSDN